MTSDDWKKKTEIDRQKKTVSHAKKVRQDIDEGRMRLGQIDDRYKIEGIGQDEQFTKIYRQERRHRLSSTGTYNINAWPNSQRLYVKFEEIFNTNRIELQFSHSRSVNGTPLPPNIKFRIGRALVPERVAGKWRRLQLLLWVSRRRRPTEPCLLYFDSALLEVLQFAVTAIETWPSAYLSRLSCRPHPPPPLKRIYLIFLAYLRIERTRDAKLAKVFSLPRSTLSSSRCPRISHARYVHVHFRFAFITRLNFK